MFNRVGAFLEAIDKRTEELADAAEEEDRARADAAHQQRQHRSGSSAGAGPSLTSSSYLPPQPPSSGTGAGRSASTTAEFHAAGLVRSHGGTPTPRGGGGPLSSSGRSGSVSAHAGASAGAGDAAMLHTLGAYAGVHVPLSLPTKLPSFRPGPHDGAEPAHETGSSGNNDGGGAAWRQRPSTSLSVPSAVPSDGTAAAAAVERLEARCRVLEADKARFQQEAATQRAQCTAARDALWTAEQEARAGRAAQRAAEQALATYKETSQRLLDEAQREVKRVREAAAGSSASASPAAAADALAATVEAAHSAQELHQRLELLQAEHAALSSEVERCRQEAAKAVAELHRVQEAHRHTQARADALRLDLDAARESLDGEAAAHAETRAALRQLQSELLLHRHHGAAGSSPNHHDTPDAALASSSTAAAATGWSEADVAQLQEVRELRQRYQMVALQASSRQAALDAAAREAADMKIRYNELAKHVRDAEVEVAAGFNAAALYGVAAPSPSSLSGFPAPPPSSTAFAGQRAFASGSGAGGAGPGASTTTAATTSDHGAHAGNSGEALRRHPAMVRLGRQYGLAGRALVASVCAIDGAAVQLGRLLTHARWAWRVALMGYIGLLQVWVVLMVIGTLALEESNAGAKLTGGASA